MSDPHTLLVVADALVALAATLKALDGSAQGHRFAPTSDEWLTPAQAAARLGVTPRWLAKRWRRLAFCHALPGGARGYRVSAAELSESMRRR